MSTKKALNALYFCFLSMVALGVYFFIKILPANNWVDLFLFLMIFFVVGFIYGLIFTIKQMTKNENRNKEYRDKVDSLHG